MAKIDFKGIDDYANALGKLWKDSEEIIKKAVYDGAEIVADEIKKGLNDIPIQEGDNGLPPFAKDGEMLDGISRRQKADLIKGFGLAPMENKSDYINTKAGFDGYGSVKTKKYPKGLPNALLMRSVESGTTFRKKHPVIRTAVNRSRKRANEKMDETINSEIEKRME